MFLIFMTSILEENIVYIQYADFQEKGAQKLEEKLKTMVNEQTTGIILDLRNNLGGILDDAVGLCDLFLDSGTVVTVKGRNNYKDSFEEFKAKQGGYTKIPMIVLINGYSASASELTAGALKDLGRAKLIGEKSYGKGTVQILEMLSDGSGLKFTTAKYYLPSGVTIDGTGIQPDIMVVLKPEDTEDLQLNKALEEIKKMAGTADKIDINIIFQKFIKYLLQVGIRKMAKNTKEEKIQVAQNKKAFYDFFILDRFEAGIVLIGCEVKSIREHRVNLKDSYAKIKNGEMFVHNMHISPYSKSRLADINPVRPRKLLMHKREITRINGKMTDKSLTIVPVSIYISGGLVKVEIAIAKGKLKSDKRDDLAKKDSNLEVKRALKASSYKDKSR